MIIGLTGTYCSGKNYAASIMEKQGLPVLDVDKLGYKALEQEKEAILAKFGPDLNGTLDRKLLGKAVFGNPEKLAALEAIVHPVANRLTNEWVASQSGNCVINAALLHKSSVFSKLDRIIIVKAPYFTRLLRARRRDKLPWREIFKRFAAQKDFYSQYLSINAEIYIIDNPGLSGSRNHKLNCQIDKFIQGIN